MLTLIFAIRYTATDVDGGRLEAEMPKIKLEGELLGGEVNISDMSCLLPLLPLLFNVCSHFYFVTRCLIMGIFCRNGYYVKCLSVVNYFPDQRIYN